MGTRYIAAIDFGTSKIALCVAQVEGENVRVVFYRETASAGVSQSHINNETNAANALSALVREAEEELGIKIGYAIVGKPKYYIRQENSQASIERNPDKEVCAEELSDLMNFAKSNVDDRLAEGETIYGAVAQSYSDGEDFQITAEDIIGRYVGKIEGNFKVFVGRKSYIDSINRACKKVGIEPVMSDFTPQTTAQVVLNHAEMENGVALVDFGGGAVSVAVYLGGIMRHYAAIPFGGRSITYDIKMECAIDERLAENLKKGYGVCTPKDLHNPSEKILRIRSGNTDPDKEISVKYLSEIISARTREIVSAVLYEIEQSGCADTLRNGIVVTGGSSALGGCIRVFQSESGYNVRTGYPKKVFSNDTTQALETSATACLGMIMAAKDSKVNSAAKRREPKPVFKETVETAATVETVLTKQEPQTIPGTKFAEKPTKETKNKTDKTPRGGLFGGLFGGEGYASEKETAAEEIPEVKEEKEVKEKPTPEEPKVRRKSLWEKLAESIMDDSEKA